MILHLDGPDNAVQDARERLRSLATKWGTRATEFESSALPSDAQKAIDPISVSIAAASLVVSIPSAVLAVVDLVDRVKKRKRATELVEAARDIQLTAVNVYLVDGHKLIMLASVEPDEVLAALTETPEGSAASSQ